MIYLAPMKKWVVEELESREKNPNKSNTKMPFVIMSSGAKILKNTGQKTRQAVLEMVGQALTGKGSVEYQGCILSNHIDSNINYSNNSLSKFDFEASVNLYAELIKPFEKYIGHILQELLHEGVAKNNLTYTGGVDENRTGDPIEPDSQ